MYTACLSCNGRLGRNRTILSFPVGQRLAYDPKKGRLWVVCPHCERWNLTPLEERWEAIEEAERLFRGTTLRVAGENISLAEPPEGPSLIRIGRAPRGELAAWRYGRELMERRGEPPGLEVAGTMTIRTLAAAAAAYLTASRNRYIRPTAATQFRLSARPEAVIDAVAIGRRGERALIRYRHVAAAELVRPRMEGPWGLRIPHEQGSIELAGREGLATLGRLLAVVNASRQPRDQVRTALQKLDHAGDPQSYFSRVASLVLRTSWGMRPDAVARPPLLSAAAPTAERLALYLACRAFWAQGGTGSPDQIPLLRLPAPDRLALEMAVHQDTERRALEGDLAELEAAWREAEEVAEIADSLFCLAPVTSPDAESRILPRLPSPVPSLS